jgi:hypothetical protein
MPYLKNNKCLFYKQLNLCVDQHLRLHINNKNDQNSLLTIFPWDLFVPIFEK